MNPFTSSLVFVAFAALMGVSSAQGPPPGAGRPQRPEAETFEGERSFDSPRPEAGRPEVERPEGGRPEGGRPEVGRPQGPPPEVTTPSSTDAEMTTEDTAGRLLSLPVPEKCANRPVHFTHDNHSYFFSGHVEEYADSKLNWLDARNICREYCMDLVSIESPFEDQMINDYIKDEDLPYIWTSGRLCNFKGCDREDLQPTHVNGWFWSGSGVKMAPTDKKPPGWTYQPWSFTGHKTKLEGRDVPQPDNAEFDINESVEACMGILNDIYEDGIKWHDIACYHTKPFICEDSEQLLEYARATSPEIVIP